MSNFIDRRLNPKDKNIRNRQKFIHRSREHIKKTVKKLIDEGSVKNLDESKIKIKVRGVSEPHFTFNQKTGDRKIVTSGNKKFVVGDTIPKPQEDGAGEGGKAGSREGQGNDDFEFLLTEDEFADFLFEELELPYLIKKQMKTMQQMTFQKAGFKNFGSPNQLDIVRSLKNSLGRRIGLRRPRNEEIEELEEQERQAEMLSDFSEQLRIKGLIEEARRRQVAIPWIDPFDVKYRNFMPQPKPVTQAVMFCLMDVSASMGEREKDTAKRFFLLLHLFLKRKYDKIDIIFISHHSEAKEVDEEEFFHSTETGGTVVSTALGLANKILEERYVKTDWNVYIAQCSDGDNARDDDADVAYYMNKLMPFTQYFAYVEISNLTTFNYGLVTDLWKQYKTLSESFPHLQMKIVYEKNEVWKVFRELFEKEVKQL